jgi:hypothetical protein
MNSTAKEVLMLIKEGKPLSRISELLLEKYDVDPIILERYLQDFINDLSLNNLMEE